MDWLGVMTKKTKTRKQQGWSGARRSSNGLVWDRSWWFYGGDEAEARWKSTGQCRCSWNEGEDDGGLTVVGSVGFPPFEGSHGGLGRRDGAAAMAELDVRLLQ